MRKINIGTTINIYDSQDELSQNLLEIILEARAALDKSHSPYSKFRVGAAARLDNGKVISGANQENASYPLCLCAEMVLLSAISSTYPNAKIETIAITARSNNRTIDMPISPCGACRQTMLEFENRQASPIAILLQGEIGPVYQISAVSDLLPVSFDGSLL